MERSGSSGCPHISCMCPNPKGAGPASQHPVGMKSTGPGVLSPLEALYNLVPISPRGKGVQYLSQDHNGRAVVEPRATVAWTSVRRAYFGASHPGRIPLACWQVVQQVGSLQAVPCRFSCRWWYLGRAPAKFWYSSSPVPKGLKINSGFFSKPGEESKN